MSSIPADSKLPASSGVSKSTPSRARLGFLKQFRFWFTLLVLTALAYGWLNRENSNLTAQDGIGYALGIIGGVSMFLLVFYPIRKNSRFMRNWIPTGYWFGAHIFLGVFGPLMILYHANFSLGSLNSSMALITMLIVVGSGLIGRFIYKKIHYGMSGRKASVKELRSDLQLTKGKLSEQFTLSQKVVNRLKAYEKASLKSRPLPIAVFAVFFIGLRSIYTYYTVTHHVRQALRNQARKNAWDRKMRRALLRSASRMMRTYIHAVRKAGEFQVYERFFSTWHLFHLPLFFLLLITGIAHVFAVHLY